MVYSIILSIFSEVPKQHSGGLITIWLPTKILEMTNFMPVQKGKLKGTILSKIPIGKIYQIVFLFLIYLLRIQFLL